ncbi:hypothetical protein L6V77_30965 [Myxococcota bacterium]|nr:hypothetical protein [Myxococcota bacterium]
MHPFGAVSVSAVGRAVDDASHASGTGLALGFVADLEFLYTRFAIGAVKGDEGDATTFSSALGHVSFTLAEQGPGLHFALIGNDGGGGLATGFGFKVNGTSESFVDISPVCGPPVGAGYTVGTRLGSGGTGSVLLAALH